MRTNFITVVLYNIRVLCEPFHQNRRTEILATYLELAQKWPKNGHFSTFFDFLKDCPYDSNETFYCHSTPDYGLLFAVSSNSYGWDWSESEGKRPKPTTSYFGTFSIFSKTVHAIRTIFLLSFYALLRSYVCNDIKIVILESEKQSKLFQKWQSRSFVFQYLDVFTTPSHEFVLVSMSLRE